MITNATESAAFKKKTIKKLELVAKQTGAVATQCITAAQGAGASNRNDASQQQLLNHCKVSWYNIIITSLSVQSVADQISQLVQSVRMSVNNPDSASAQLSLINASESMITVCTHVCHHILLIRHFPLANWKDGGCSEGCCAYSWQPIFCFAIGKLRQINSGCPS